jgi:NAD(P)-dependent dehydrogenase (short-subunit alcohol dehydrogenase family)
MNDMLSGKVVVVAGGAGLLGRQFCIAIANAGGVAVVADRDLDGARRVSEEIIKQNSGRADEVVMDITDKDSIVEAIRVVSERHGAIDAVVNSAYPRNPRYGRRMEDVTYTDFCENLCMHLGGYFLVAQQFAAVFRKYGRGNIINISSIYGVIAPRFAVYEGTRMTMPVEYAAVKSSVLHLTRYFAKYLKGSGIRVNAISPGGIYDNQPQGFVEKYNAMCLSKGMLEEGDIAGTLLFLLSDAATYINGQNLIVDDGFSL